MTAAASEAAEAHTPRLTRGVQVLMALSAAVVFLQLTILDRGYVVGALGFSWGDFGRWWSPVTYAVVHASALHMAVNMYALWMFGPRLEAAWGTRRFTWFYFGCAIGGLLLHAAFARSEAPLIGASAAVFGVMTAYAMQWPDEDVLVLGILPIRVWTMVMIFAGLSLLIGLLGNPGEGPAMALFAHLGGAVTGWMYMRTPGNSSSEQYGPRISRVPDVEEPPRPIPRSQPRARERMEEVDEIVARSKAIAARRGTATARPRPQPEDRSSELDRVLDKISAEGLESLSDEERQLLDEAARRLREPD